MAGTEPGIRQRQESASAHPEGRPRRATLPARPADRQPRLLPSNHRLPPRRPGAAVRRRTRRRLRPVLRRKAHGLRGSQRRFSHTRSAARSARRAVLGPAPHNRRRAAADWSASGGLSSRTGSAEQDMPPPFSTTRLAFTSADVPLSRVTARQADGLVWLGLTASAAAWGRCHLVCHWLRGLTAGPS